MDKKDDAKFYKNDEEARVCASSSEIRSRINRSSSRSSDRAACFFDFFTSGSTGIVHHKVKRLSDFAYA
jgi:hypothetical protein